MAKTLPDRETLPDHALSFLLSANRNSRARLSPADIRKACIEELRVHYIWYDRAKRLHAAIWLVATISLVALSAITTVAVAFGTAASDNGRFGIGIVSALVTAISTLLATFATRDTWQLRENGRIAISDLLARACLIPDGKPEDALEEAVQLLNEAHQIEEAQAKGYFGFLNQQTSRPSASAAKRPKNPKD